MDETLAPYFYKEKNEKRMPIKQLFNTQADITVKEEEQNSCHNNSKSFGAKI
jgi:hypothetical protein